jgi:hypothetical protein
VALNIAVELMMNLYVSLGSIRDPPALGTLRGVFVLFTILLPEVPSDCWITGFFAPNEVAIKTSLQYYILVI